VEQAMVLVIAILVSLFIGGSAGFALCALCVAASRDDDADLPGW
jgi:hypothetical protein